MSFPLFISGAATEGPLRTLRPGTIGADTLNLGLSFAWFRGRGLFLGFTLKFLDFDRLDCLCRFPFRSPSSIGLSATERTLRTLYPLTIGSYTTGLWYTHTIPLFPSTRFLTRFLLHRLIRTTGSNKILQTRRGRERFGSRRGRTWVQWG